MLVGKARYKYAVRLDDVTAVDLSNTVDNLESKIQDLTGNHVMLDYI